MTSTAHIASSVASGPTEQRIAGTAGVLAATALAGAFLVLPVDAGGTSPEDVAARYAEGADGYRLAAVLEIVSLGLTAVLVAGLCTWVARSSALARTLAALGGAVLVTCQLGGYAVITTLALGTAETAGHDVVTALYDLSAVLFVVANAGLALLAASVAAAIRRRHRLLAAWSVVTAVAAAVGALVLNPDGVLSPHGDFTFLVLVLQLAWTLATGITLLRTPRH